MRFSLPWITAFVINALVTVAAPTKQSNDTVNFLAEYKLLELEDVTKTDVAELTNGHDITLGYELQNLDDRQVSVVGVGGSFRDPKNGEIKTNLSTGAVDPIILAKGEAGALKQKIELNLVPGHYILSPVLYVAVGDELKMIQVRGQLSTVSDEPISFFNPQLLFLEAVLLATFAAFGYVAYNIWGKKYLQGASPIPKASKKPAKKASSPSEATATGKSYDSSWIPETHLKHKKTKKAY